MRTFSKAAFSAIGSAMLWAAVSIVPLVPVEVSPVVPDPISRSAFTSILGLVTSPFLMGMRVQPTWATLPVVLGLSAAAIIAGRKLGRRLVDRS
jgi:hypothetical protein